MAHNIKVLEQVWQGLSASKSDNASGQIFGFVSTDSGNGTSYITRQMALIAAREQLANGQSSQSGQSGLVLIVDMDIQNSAQAEHFFSAQAISENGTPEGPYDACFGEQGFWRVSPAMLGDDGHVLSDSHFMSLHLVPGLPLGFTNFHWEKFKRGQSVHIQEARQYWQALRARFYAVFVDIPALDRSDVLRSVCPDIDQTILVSNPADCNLRPVGDLYTKIKAMNANSAGIIINELPRFGSLYGGQR